jgi:hypothetical protein
MKKLENAQKQLKNKDCLRKVVNFKQKKSQPGWTSLIDVNYACGINQMYYN